jgi:hypothetical protein
LEVTIAITTGRTIYDRSEASIWLDADYEKHAASVCHRRMLIEACADDESIELALQLFRRLREEPDADLSGIATHAVHFGSLRTLR